MFLLCLLWHRALSQVKFTVCYYRIELSSLPHARLGPFPFTLSPKLLMLKMLEPSLQGVDSIAYFPYLINCLCEAFFLVLKRKKAIRHGLVLTEAEILGSRQLFKEIIIMQ